MDEQPNRPDAAGGGERDTGSLGSDPGAVAPTLPSTGARLLGFAAILAAGAAGGFIGYAVTGLQCRGDCTINQGIGGLIGAVIAALGVAVVVQLALRAMHEWRVIEARGDAEAERQRRRSRREPPGRPTPRARPRVR
jgi:hypothetical protein